jgi:hypothetical protein
MKTFQQAQKILSEKKTDIKNDAILQTFFRGIVKMSMTREPRFIDLVENILNWKISLT